MSESFDKEGSTNGVPGLDNTPIFESTYVAKKAMIARGINLLKIGASGFEFQSKQNLAVLEAIERLHVGYEIPKSFAQTQVHHNAMLEMLQSYPELKSRIQSTNEEMSKQANEAIKREQYEQAVFHLNRMAAGFAMNADTYVKRATAFKHLARFEEAINDCNIALSIASNCGDAHHVLGKIYVKLERFEEAIREQELAMELDPENMQYRHAWATTYLKYTRYLASHDPDAATKLLVELEEVNLQGRTKMDVISLYAHMTLALEEQE